MPRFEKNCSGMVLNMTNRRLDGDQAMKFKNKSVLSFNEHAKKDQIVIDSVLIKLKEDTNLIVYDRNPIRHQPDIEIVISNIVYNPNKKEVAFLRSDSDKPKELSDRSFCLVTKLVKRDPQDFLIENTELTSKLTK